MAKRRVARVIGTSEARLFLFRAVTIDGEPYWDGGYMGNPAIFPLIYGAETPDVVIVQVNPLGCDRIPTTATEIMNRLNEISFNSLRMREMRAVSFVTDLIDQGKLSANQYKRINVHWIEATQPDARPRRVEQAQRLHGLPVAPEGDRPRRRRALDRQPLRRDRPAVDDRYPGRSFCRQFPVINLASARSAISPADCLVRGRQQRHVMLRSIMV